MTIEEQLEEFLGKQVFIRFSHECIASHHEGVLRQVTFDTGMYRVSNDKGAIIFPLSKVTQAIQTDYTSIIELQCDEN